MKKTLTIVLTFALIVCCAFAFTACDQETVGKSAYELAVDNGFEGTLSEWLDSLNGTDGTDGANGTNGVDGRNGTDGKNGEITVQDLYDTALENGFTGTYKDFVAEYFNVNISSDNRYTISQNLLSSVSIVCGFDVTTSTMEYIAGQGWVSTPHTNTAYSAGSGVFYSIEKENGSAYIITNYHVVYNSSSDNASHISEKISVYLYGSEVNGQEIAATYVGGSMTYDLAVLYVGNSEAIKNSEAIPVTFADSNDICVGETAIAIGNAEGSGISATTGTINVDSEDIKMTGADDKTQVNFRVMRIDTAVNPGNSGGGLFDSDGKLIGIVNAKIQSSSVEGIGYALPSNVVKYVVENILYYKNTENGGIVKKCMLGVTVLTKASKAVYDSEHGTTRLEETIMVYEHVDETTKEDTSIKEDALVYGTLKDGDLINSLKIDRSGDGTIDETYRITRSYMIVDLMLTMRVGDKITLIVDRPVEGGGTEVKEFTYTMTENCIKTFA